MKMKILLLLLLLLATTNSLMVLEIPDCMCVPLSYPSTGHLINQDSSLIIDTCGIWYPSVNCDSVYWNNITSENSELAKGRIYAKKPWSIRFEVDAIPLEPAPWDTNLYVTWTAIDSSNYPEIRSRFEFIEHEFGSYKLRKVYPDKDTGIDSREFILIFDDYTWVLTLTNYCNNIPYTHAEFIGWPSVPQSDVNDDNGKNVFSISPNPANEYIEINVGENGRRQSADGRQEWDIQIYNVYGECVLSVGANGSSPVQRIDVSSFPDGIYFIKLSESSGLSESYGIYKFVVMK
ncbi:MAG: T9SS type A sorting domain-containing protein [bacterium]